MEKIRAVMERIIGVLALIFGIIAIVTGVLGKSSSIILGVMLMFGGLAILKARSGE